MNKSSMKRIHIVGSGPRTGTTLLAEAMIACFDIDKYTDHEDRIFCTTPEEARIFLTKCPKDIMVVRPILRADPDLYVVCMVRDPRDTIVSKHGKDSDNYWAGLRYWKTYIPYWRRIQGHPRFITIRYEDLVADPDSAQETLERRMTFLRKRAPFSRYHEVAKPSSDSQDALRGVRPIAPVGVGSWKSHLSRVAGQILLHGPITEDLIEFGYEQDASWESMLVGIQPDTRPSHLPEYATQAWKKEVRAGVYTEVAKVLLRRVGVL